MGQNRGGNFDFNMDQSNSNLEKIQQEVDLLDITQYSFPDIYRLKGTNAQIIPNPSFNTGCGSDITSPTTNFFFTKNLEGFEATTAHYHIDSDMRYWCLKIKKRF